MIKLHYFNIYGRIEPIRMLLNHAKVPYTENLISYQDWPKFKTSGICEFEQIPVVEIGDKKLSQSKAILRYLGKLHGYYPADPYHAYLADSYMDSFDDISPAFFQARSEKDAEKQKVLYDKLFNQTYPKWCQAIENRIQQNVTRKFLVGEKLSIADFSFAGRHFGLVKNPLSPIQNDLQAQFSKFKGLSEYADNLEAIFKDYLEARPKCQY
ncbi:glutathione s-transferase [Stylonychia lemnae]|uniref:Glutathione s-transferase n=1 Tax=Stylonychia lemnae TaxID=5949 RepID=A0A078B3E6_STYLE|nr:glutathione s-transferase [Stylonychia lemnae]|eukprot:CDW89050.1 glutathione s-transferase [Stylonychia lemnae]